VKVLLETIAKFDIQQKMREGELEYVWSTVLDFENAAKRPFEEYGITIVEVSSGVAWPDRLPKFSHSTTLTPPMGLPLSPLLRR